MSIKDYLLKSFFFPRTITINDPGVIINKTSSKFFKETCKKRIIYSFEDIIIDLIKESEKKLGIYQTKVLYYSIGKDIGYRYFLWKKRPIIPRILIPEIITYSLQAMRSAGMSLADEIELDVPNQYLRVRGKDNLICRKTGNGEIFAGAISSFFSLIMGQNIEAKKTSCSFEDEFCEIICNPGFPSRSGHNGRQNKPFQQYEEYNFPPVDAIKQEASSFQDFMRFQFINISKGKRFHFRNKTICPAEIGWYGIITEHYKRNGLGQLLFRAISNAAGNLFSLICPKNFSRQEKLAFLKSMLCSFGWGFPFFSKRNGALIIQLVYPPFSKYSFHYQLHELRGYLQSLYSQELQVQEVKKDFYSKMISVYFRF